MKKNHGYNRLRCGSYFILFFFWNKINRQFIAHQKILLLYPPLLKKKKKALKKNWQKNLNYLDTQLVVFHSQKTLRQFRFVVFFYFTPIISTIILIFLNFFWVSTNLSCVVLCISPPPLPPLSAAAAAATAARLVCKYTNCFTFVWATLQLLCHWYAATVD